MADWFVFILIVSTTAIQQLLPGSEVDSIVTDMDTRNLTRAPGSRLHTLNGSKGSDYTSFRKATKHLANITFTLETSVFKPKKAS